jgi:hypothetical protein
VVDVGFEHLGSADREVIRLCLVAAVDGPWFADEEFHTLFGLDRGEVASVRAAWSAEPPLTTGGRPPATETQRLAINNALVNLLGYPHGHRGEAFRREVGVSEAQVRVTLARLRGDDGGAGHVAG